MLGEIQLQRGLVLRHSKATEAKFLGFLRDFPRFVIPIYQHTYSWTECGRRQLWDDIVRTSTNSNP